MSLYPCAGGGSNDYVYVMAVTPTMWEALCRVIDREDLIQNPQFSRQADRYENRDELRGIIGAWALMRDKYQAMRELAEGGVPASAVLDTSDLYNNSHLVQRGFVHEVEHPSQGAVKLLGWPARMSESSVEIEAAPLLGEHSNEVLNNDLGLTQTELDDLTKQGVIQQMASNSTDR